MVLQLPTMPKNGTSIFDRHSPSGAVHQLQDLYASYFQKGAEDMEQHINDGGERQEFETGAVREPATGKG